MSDKQQAPAVNYVFTWWALPFAELHDIQFKHCKQAMTDMMQSWPDVKYLVAGWEHGEHQGEQGWHFQGYVQWTTKKRITALKKLHQQIHWEVAKGGWEQNYDYCTKGDDFFEVGNKPATASHPGTREKERWAAAYQAAREGDFENIPGDIALRQWGNIHKIHGYFTEPVHLNAYNVEWFYGKTGSGKSTAARKENPEVYLKDTNKWWDGYKGEKCVLIEEVDPDNCKGLAAHYKKWFDKYVFLGETKGGYTKLRPEKIVVTSQYLPEECFQHRDAEAILRRIKLRRWDAWREVDCDGNPVEKTDETTPVRLTRDFNFAEQSTVLVNGNSKKKRKVNRVEEEEDEMERELRLWDEMMFNHQ